MSHARIQSLPIALCLLASCIVPMHRADGSDLQTLIPMDAIWRAQHVPFVLQTSGIFHSCESMSSKIAAILIAVGAREDVAVNLRCRAGALTNSVITTITVATAVHATPENVRAATTYSPEQLLIARLNDVDLPSATDLERFPAQWRSVTIGRGRTVNLEAADCPLLRALAEQVFPRMAVRLSDTRLRCAQDGGSRLRPKLQVTALLPAKPAPVTYATRTVR